MSSLKSLLRSFGKSAAGFSLPSTTNRAIGLSDFESYIAPSDGWIVFYNYSQSEGYLGIYAIVGSQVQCRSDVPTRKDTSAAVYLPVRKGMEVRKDGETPSEIYFIPCDGV